MPYTDVVIELASNSRLHFEKGWGLKPKSCINKA